MEQTKQLSSDNRDFCLVRDRMCQTALASLITMQRWWSLHIFLFIARPCLPMPYVQFELVFTLHGRVLAENNPQAKLHQRVV